MTDLSPAAQAVLTAATQRLYCLDPEDVPNEAARIACEAATALRAVADQVVPESCFESDDAIRVALLAIAAELEGAQ